MPAVDWKKHCKKPLQAPQGFLKGWRNPARRVGMRIAFYRVERKEAGLKEEK
jgi:hypothetical protein